MFITVIDHHKESDVQSIKCREDTLESRKVKIENENILKQKVLYIKV